MGDGTSVQVHPIGDTLHTLMTDLDRSIDMDGDGINDIQFKFRSANSLGAGYLEWASVQSLHPEVRVASLTVTDTIFFHVDTAGTSIHKHHNCSRTDDTDTIVSVTTDQLKIRVLEEGSTLNDEGEFSTDSINLRNLGGGSSMPTFQGGYWVSWQTNMDCYLFPLDVIRYIGVAITAPNGSVKLGWIKLLDSPDYSRWILYETAIQQ